MYQYTFIRHTVAPNPEGCRWCGHDREHHAWQWVASKGLHRWKEPTPAQRLARIRARRERTRAARTARTAGARAQRAALAA